MSKNFYCRLIEYGSVFSIGIGALLGAVKIGASPWCFPIMLFGCLLLAVHSYRVKNGEVFLIALFFMMVNTVGVVRWLII